MQRFRFVRLWRRPGIAFIGMLLFGFTTAIAVYKACAVERIILTKDPVQVAEYNVGRALTPSEAIDQINDALSAGESDIAESFVALAASHYVVVPSALIARVHQESADRNTIAAHATEIAIASGEFVGDFAGEFVDYSDFRDFGREGLHCVTGEHCSGSALGHAGAGIALAGVSFVVAAPERSEASLVRVADQKGWLNSKLAWKLCKNIVKSAKLSTVTGFVGDLITIYENGSFGTALDTINLIEVPEDAALVARLSLTKGKEVRAILRLLGRKAFRLEEAGTDRAAWVLWAILGFFGFCASCKTTAERMMERHLRRSVSSSRATPVA
jgi:hypothetical protein